MLSLPSETIGHILDKVDFSSRLSLWWTSKIFRPLIQLNKTILQRIDMTAFAAKDGNVKIYDWLTKCKFPTNKITVFNAGLSGEKEMMKKFSTRKQKHFVTSLRDGVIKNGSFSAYSNYNDLIPTHVWKNGDILRFRDSKVLDHHISSCAITVDDLYAKYMDEITTSQNYIEYFIDRMCVPRHYDIERFFQYNTVAEITLSFTLRMIEMYSILKELIVRQTLRRRTWMMKDIPDAVEIISNGGIPYLLCSYSGDGAVNTDKVTTWIIENKIIFTHDDFHYLYSYGSQNNLRKYLAYASHEHQEYVLELGEISNLEKLELLHEFKIPFVARHARMNRHDCKIVDFLQEINQDVSYLVSLCSRCCEKYFPSVSLEQAVCTYDFDFVKKVYIEDSESVGPLYFNDEIPDEKIIPILEFLIEKGKYKMEPRNYDYNSGRPKLIELFLQKNCPLTPRIRGMIAEKYPSLIHLLVGK